MPAAVGARAIDAGRGQLPSRGAYTASVCHGATLGGVLSVVVVFCFFFLP
jgi:hypothetical protein